MSLTRQQINIVLSNTTELNYLLNVNDEEQCRSHEWFPIENSNAPWTETLCKKMVQDIELGNTAIYDALCEYFLKRSEAYKSMHQRFTAFPSSNSNIISSNDGSKPSQPVNSSTNPEYKYRSHGEFAEGWLSKSYLWQRTSDGNMFVMKRYTNERLSKAWRDAKMRETAYLIENIMIQPHPCILHFVECFLDNEEKLCVVVEQCSDEKLAWLIDIRQDELLSETDMMNWVTQLCLVEEHIQRLEEQMNIGIIYNIHDIFLKYGSTGDREVKVRLHQLPLSKDNSRVKTMRQSNIMSIFERLLPKAFKISNDYSDAFKKFAGDFHKRKFSTMTELMNVSIVEKAIKEANQFTLGTVTPRRRFIPIAIIGRGSFGTVEKMWDKDEKNLRAIKKVQIDMSPNDMREITAMKQCQHENIVKMVDHFIVENIIMWIVMEYCDGGNLHDRIQAQGGGAFSCQQVSFFFIPILKALQYLHEETKYFHGDIKPRNILLCKYPSEHMVKLGDFGAAHFLSPNQSVMSTFRRIGTPEYMAPEILEFQPCGKRADLWSLGCLLYEIVALSPAFKFETEDQMIEGIKNAKPMPIPHHIPASSLDVFNPVINGLLCKEPQHRMTLQTVTEFSCFSDLSDNANEIVSGAENRIMWFDGHAPLLELDECDSYPMVPLTNETKLSLLKQVDQQEDSLKSYPTTFWLRIYKQNEDWIVEYAYQDYGDNTYLVSHIAVCLFLPRNNNGDDGLKICAERNGVFSRQDWTEVLRFSNIFEMPKYIQVSLGSKQCDSRELVHNTTHLTAKSDGVYPLIDCYSRERNRSLWSEMCRPLKNLDQLYLATILVPEIEQCFVISLVRVQDNLWVDLQPEREKSSPQFVLLQLDCRLMVTNTAGKEIVLEKSQLVDFRLFSQKSSNLFVCFEDIFTLNLQSLIPPCINISLRQPKEEVKFWWRGMPPITMTHHEEGKFEQVVESIRFQADFIRWISMKRSLLWLPAIILPGGDETLAIAISFGIDWSGAFMSINFHPEVPPQVSSARVTISIEINVNWRNNKRMFLLAEESSLVIGQGSCKVYCDIEDDILYDINETNVGVFTSPRATISIENSADCSLNTSDLQLMGQF